jgi:hypothetical protein
MAMVLLQVFARAGHGIRLEPPEQVLQFRQIGGLHDMNVDPCLLGTLLHPRISVP